VPTPSSTGGAAINAVSARSPPDPGCAAKRRASGHAATTSTTLARVAKRMPLPNEDAAARPHELERGESFSRPSGFFDEFADESEQRNPDGEPHGDRRKNERPDVPGQERRAGGAAEGTPPP
jgi:hypothetical protein